MMTSRGAVGAMVTVTALTMLWWPHQVSGGRILMYPFAHCSNSHLLNFEKMAGILGPQHEVMMLLPSTYSGPYSNSRLDDVKFIKYTLPQNLSIICNFDSLNEFLETSLLDIMATFYKSTYRVCDWLLGSHDLLEKLKVSHFDLAIFDAVDPCTRILADYLDVPFIVFNTQGLENILPRHPAYMPSLLSSFTNEMSLLERVLNTVSYLVQKIITHTIMHYYQELRLKHHLNTSLHVLDTYNRASLRFILGDYGLDYVGPSQPSHILIGGSIETPAEPMDDTIQDFITGGDFNDVLIVSLGSMIKYYGTTWRDIFAAALAKVPYQVIWRYNDQELPATLGNNTLLRPWLPQAELLALSRTKILVTHCGMNAVYEAAQHGVPVVGIPLYGDQFFQANKIAKHAGMGTVLSIKGMTSDDLYKAIMHLRTHPHYLQNAERISFILKNRPFSQREQISKWVDNVIKLGGTPHLHSQPYYNLCWYQYFLCDVFLVISLCSLLMVVVLVYIAAKFIVFISHHVPHVVSLAGGFVALHNIITIVSLNTVKEYYLERLTQALK